MTARPSAGPWGTDEILGGIRVIGEPGYEGIPDNWREVCCISTYEEEEIDMDRANARLIAAAPELLEACYEAESELRKLVGQFGLGFSDARYHPTIKQLLAAIAKATGASEQ